MSGPDRGAGGTARQGRRGPDPLRRTARERPDAVAVEFPAPAGGDEESSGGEESGGADSRGAAAGDATWTWRQLDRRADALAVRVAEEAGRDGRVAALLPRVPAAVAALHGVPRAGAAFVPLHAGWTPREVAAFLEVAVPDCVLCTPATEAKLRRAAPNLRPVVLDPRLRDLGPPPEDAADALPGPLEDADHAIVPTSGTTSGPRGVRLGLSAHLASARGARERLDLRAGDAWLAALAPAHVGGLELLFRAATVGCRVVLREGFDADELARLMDAGRVSHVSLVPAMLRRLLDAREGRPPPESFRCALVGGAAAPPALLERAAEAELPVAVTYGLSEAASQVATAPPDLVRRKPGTVGPPLPGVEVRIGNGREGEILVRGPTLMRGYLGGEGTSPVRDGWLHTGDLGGLDGDGHLWVTGRRSERIVTGGVTVSPGEVEAVLSAHPRVREAAVVGVPDEEWGETVAAAVVASRRPKRSDGPGPPRGRGTEPGGRPEVRKGVDSADEPGLEAELDRHCRQGLSAPRRPRLYRFLPDLPRTPTGKPDREAIRRLLSASRTEGERP